MARARDKASLLQQGNGNFVKLFELIDSLTAEQQVGTFSFEDRDRNLRDVLIHLYEWHRLVLDFTGANLEGDKPQPFLPAPYNWRNYGEMNIEFWQKHQQTPLEDAKKMVQDSHEKVMELAEKFSDEELFTKKYFNWTGTTSLGSYLVSSTSSHYDWAIKKIKFYKKSLV